MKQCSPFDPTYTMPIGDVADALEVCSNRVRQLDPILQPIRRRGMRRYNPQRVAEVLAERRAKAR